MSLLDQFATPFEAYEWSSKMGAKHKTKPIKTGESEHFINICVYNELGYMIGMEMLLIGGKNGN